MMMGGGDGGGGGNTNQFIGSKISLISKSEIRYEGILHSLDLEEATISLSKVRSFGTEDRPTARPVGPKDEVYEFIIFRGTDIKGIDVLEPPPAATPSKPEVDDEPIDPAIVEVQHYQPSSSHQQSQQHAHHVVHGGPGPIGSGVNSADHHEPRMQQRNSFGNSFGPGGVLPPQQQQNAGGFSLGVGFGAPPQQRDVQQERPADGRIQDRGVMQGQGHMSNAAAIGPPSPLEGSSMSSPEAHRGGQQRNTQRRGYAPRGRGGSSSAVMPMPPQQQQPQHQSRGNMNNNMAYNVRAGGGRGGGGQYYNRYHQGNSGGGGGGGGGGRNYFRRGELKGNKKLTFDEEFNFEKANEELQRALLKIKIADDKESVEEEEPHHVDGGSDEETVEDKENESKAFYSKDNFFDSISCEALERKSGKREKPDWRAERKLNAETFGLPMKPGGGRGGSSTFYRGGGNYHNYHNYSRGGYYSRGGENQRGFRGGNYRGRGGFRNTNNRGGGGGGAQQQQQTQAGGGGVKSEQ